MITSRGGGSGDYHARDNPTTYWSATAIETQACNQHIGSSRFIVLEDAAPSKTVSPTLFLDTYALVVDCHLWHSLH